MAADPATGEAQAAVIALEAALSDLDLGLSTGQTARPWAAVAADMDRFNTKLRPACDYAAQGVVLPGLLRELHTLYVTDPEHRADVLRALMDCYQMAGVLLKNLGVRGLPVLASFRAQQMYGSSLNSARRVGSVVEGCCQASIQAGQHICGDHVELFGEQAAPYGHQACGSVEPDQGVV